MFIHIVLMRFDDAADAQEAERRLRLLPDSIDVIRRMTIGQNVVPSERAYDLGLVVELDSQEDLETYDAHPEHQAVAAFMRERRSGSASCDYPG